MGSNLINKRGENLVCVCVCVQGERSGCCAKVWVASMMHDYVRDAGVRKAFCYTAVIPCVK